MKILPFGAEAPEIKYIQVEPYDDGVLIRVVDKNGTPFVASNLLKINQKGIFRFNHVNPALGFERDSLGRIKETDGE